MRRILQRSGVVIAGFVIVMTASAAAIDTALPLYTRTTEVTGELICAGGDTMQDLVEAWTRAFQRLHPHARVRLDRGTRLSADGFAAFLDGRVDLVTFVREPFSSEIAAFKTKFGYAPLLVNVAGGSYATKGGTHAIAIYVNAANPLTQLTLAQLDAIFSQTRRRGAAQEVTTWGQLGITGAWARHPIHLYGMLHQRDTGNPPGIVNYLQQRVLLGGEFRDDVREQVDKTGESALEAIVRRVAADPDAIGYSGFAYREPGAKTLALAETSDGPFYAGGPDEVARRDYPLSRQIYLAINRAPGQSLTPLMREFLRFTLSRQGQQTVADDRMQFMPLTAPQAAAARTRLD